MSKSWDIIRGKRGGGSVSCYVSERWLKFQPGPKKENFGTSVWIDVMTDAGGEERKLTSVTLEELEAALKFIKAHKIWHTLTDSIRGFSRETLWA